MASKLLNAQNAVANLNLLVALSDYHPEVVSTIFVGLDIDDSDIDIVCCYKIQAEFIEKIRSLYSQQDAFAIQIQQDYLVVRFYYSQFEFEIYASPIEVKFQAGYRHFHIMKRLVDVGGEMMKTRIRKLKQTGLKTEPAIAQLFGLKGDPYHAVLEIESWSQLELKTKIAHII